MRDGGGAEDAALGPHDPACRTCTIRPRKFYATRPTFISWGLSQGVNLKWLAEYRGTSVEMIERSYDDRRTRPAHPRARGREGVTRGWCRTIDAGGGENGTSLKKAVGSDLNPAIEQGSTEWSQGESNGEPANAEDAEKAQQPSEVAAVVVEEQPSTKRPEKARKNPKRGANTGPGPVGES